MCADRELPEIDHRNNKIIVSIASGKGGTGKTTVAVNLALALSKEESLQFLDCDVEEPNSHIFLKPVFNATETVSIPVPDVNEEKCTYCGRCAEVCAFNALAVTKSDVMLFLELCHGCGGCAYFCPEDAIKEVPRGIGVLEKGYAYEIPFLHGRLNPGEAMSPPLINAVKGKIDFSGHVIIDSPPGTSCPVVSTVKGSDFCLLVTEPTPFGLNDLDVAAQMLKKLDIPVGVLINRSDIGNSDVEDYCGKNGLPVLMKIPFDMELAKLYAKGEPVVLYSAEWADRFRDLWQRVLSALEKDKKERKERDVGKRNYHN